jgi:hypothetical protein
MLVYLVGIGTFLILLQEVIFWVLLRIGKLEESMETLSSIFSSLEFKKEKAFVGKEQKFMYVP